MRANSEIRSEREARVDDAIAAFFEARKNGQPLDRNTFLAKYSDLEEELSIFLANQSKFDKANGIAMSKGDETISLPPIA